MHYLNKTLIAFLLIVAIPVQGFAATAMRMCSPGHHGAAVTANLPPPQAANHHHKHAAQMSHKEPSSDHVVATAAGDFADGKCSACAACCVALAMVSSRLIAENSANTAVLIPFLANAFSNHISDGLDPPPRSILA